MSHEQPPQFQAPEYQQAQFQPSYQQQVPSGMLQLTIQGSALTSNMIPPTVYLNRYPVPVKYGRNDIPVFAGPLHIDIHSQWIRTYGQASLDCTVQPNQAVPVFYASPYHQFMSGSIGHTKVKRKGLGVLLGVVGAILAVVVLVNVLAALG
ncbi:hypothetical protein GCM10009630_59680 [Kribbella jejuensis]|uniref:Uncharacterized protein n=1 Tax=Kribbella jejuensis TaxID=236068 RepID=A0A542ETK0_9ACTN|nr:hypothetical protein [Kribbella jejuensis]TQJ18681.1 hypothetical protein FB475_2829 [Kribbella jejuensis]